MGRFFWVLGILLLVGTLIGAWYLNHNGAFQSQPRPARGDDPLPAKIMCAGFADTELGVIKMYPVRAGEVVYVIAEGTDVKKNAVLLKLDETQAKTKVDLAQVDLNVALQLEKKAKLRPQQHEFQIAQLQAKIDAAKSSVKAAEEHLERERKVAQATGKFNFKQYEEELKAKQEELKVPEAALDELKVYNPQMDIDAAAENVASKRLQLKEAQFGLSKCSLKAPEDGRVLQVSINAGEVVGSNPTQPVLLFAPNVPRIVKAEVIQEWASHVEIGQEAFVEDDTYRGPTWKGKVKQIAGFYSHKTPIREPFMMIDQRILQCIIEIEPGQSPPLRIGQRVRVSITPTQK